MDLNSWIRAWRSESKLSWSRTWRIRSRRGESGFSCGSRLLLSMSDSPNYITPRGFQRLQEEFKRLFHDERPKLVETVAWAASNGDRSENADYIYGKRRLREIDKRLKFLRDRIEGAKVVDPTTIKSEKVVFGATVSIIDEEGDERIYQIVGEDEIEPGQNKISWKSPMAKALLGKEVGDEVEIARPAGRLMVEITNIRY